MKSKWTQQRTHALFCIHWFSRPSLQDSMASNPLGTPLAGVSFPVDVSSLVSIIMNIFAYQDSSPKLQLKKSPLYCHILRPRMRLK